MSVASPATALVLRPLYLGNFVIVLGLSLFPHAWVARAPAIVPALWPYVPATRAFDWRTVVGREFSGLAVILMTPFLLDIVEDLHGAGAFDLDPLWTVTAVLGAGVCGVLRFLKKRRQR